MKVYLDDLSPYERHSLVPVYNEKMSLLAIANYNLGSQHEFLDEFPDAIQRYQMALTLASSGPNKESPLIEEFAMSLKQVKFRYTGFKMKKSDRTFTNLSRG